VTELLRKVVAVDGDAGLVLADCPAGLTLRDLLDASPDGLLYVGEDGAIGLSNRRAEEMFGYPRGGLVGLQIEALVPAAVRAQHMQHRAAYGAAPSVREMGLGRRLVGVRAGGEPLPVEISLSPVVHAAGRGVIATVRDDTTRRHINAAMTTEAVLADEGRIAKQLLDTVISRLFRAGLVLNGTLEQCDERTRARIEEATAQIDEVIRAMRQTIFAGPDGPPR